MKNLIGSLILFVPVALLGLPEVSADELAQIACNNKEVAILDVRTQKEWDEGHLLHADHKPIDTIESSIQQNQLDRNQTYYIHCKTGRRAAIAANILKKYGYQAVVVRDTIERILSVGLPKIEHGKLSPSGACAR